jgi:hypothetical protein
VPKKADDTDLDGTAHANSSRPRLLYGKADEAALRRKGASDPRFASLLQQFARLVDGSQRLTPGAVWAGDDLSSHTLMQMTAVLYAGTGNATRARQSKVFLLEHIRGWAAGVSKYSPNCMEGARELQTVTAAFDMIAAAAQFTPQELVVAERAMGNVAQALMTRNSSYNAYDYYLERYRLDNFNSDRIAAVGLFALTFPHHPNASMWLKHAATELTWQMSNNLMADGAWPEGPRYHGDVLRAFVPLAYAMRRNGPFDPFVSLPKLGQMASYYLLVQTPPDETLGGISLTPGVSDANWEANWEAVLGWSAAGAAGSDAPLARAMMWGWERAGSPFSVEFSPANMIAGFVLVDPAIQAERGSTQRDSATLESGYVVIRSGGDSGHYCLASVRTKRQSWEHHHPDRGGLSIFAFNTPIAVDPGVGGYSGSSFTDWFGASLSHNMVTVESASMHDGNHVVGKPFRTNSRAADRSRSAVGWGHTMGDATVEASSFDGHLHYFSANITTASGLPSYHRSVFFMPGADFYVVFDSIAAAKQASERALVTKACARGDAAQAFTIKPMATPGENEIEWIHDGARYCLSTCEDPGCTAVPVVACNDHVPDQRWTWTNETQLVNVKSSDCMTGSQDSASVVSLTDCGPTHQQTNQSWRIVGNQIHSRAGDVCLAVSTTHAAAEEAPDRPTPVFNFHVMTEHNATNRSTDCHRADTQSRTIRCQCQRNVTLDVMFLSAGSVQDIQIRPDPYAVKMFNLPESVLPEVAYSRIPTWLRLPLLNASSDVGFVTVLHPRSVGTAPLHLTNLNESVSGHISFDLQSGRSTTWSFLLGSAASAAAELNGTAAALKHDVGGVLEYASMYGGTVLSRAGLQLHTDKPSTITVARVAVDMYQLRTLENSATVRLSLTLPWSADGLARVVSVWQGRHMYRLLATTSTGGPVAFALQPGELYTVERYRCSTWATAGLDCPQSEQETDSATTLASETVSRPRLLFNFSDRPRLRAKLQSQEWVRPMLSQYKIVFQVCNGTGTAACDDNMRMSTLAQMASVLYLTSNSSAYALSYATVAAEGVIISCKELEATVPYTNANSTNSSGFSLQTYRQLQGVMQVFDAVADSGVFNVTTATYIETVLAMSTARLMERCPPPVLPHCGANFNEWDMIEDEPFRLGNINTDRLVSVATFALTFPDHPKSSAWLDHAESELRYQLNFSVFPGTKDSGGAWQGGIRYHGAVLRCVIPLAYALRRHGRFDAFQDDNFKALLRYLILVQTPRDKTANNCALTPALSDSLWEPSWEATLGWAAPGVADADLALAAELSFYWERACSPLSVENSPGNWLVPFLFVDTRLAPSLPQRPRPSVHLSSGITVLRGGDTTPDGDEPYFLLSADTQRSCWHVHPDRGAISALYFNGVPLILDPGDPTSYSDASFTSWYKASISHTMVTFADADINSAASVESLILLPSVVDVVAVDISSALPSDGSRYVRTVYHHVAMGTYLVHDSLTPGSSAEALRSIRNATNNLHVLTRADATGCARKSFIDGGNVKLLSCPGYLGVTLDVAVLSPNTGEHMIEQRTDRFPTTLVEATRNGTAMKTLPPTRFQTWVRVTQPTKAPPQDFITVLRPYNASSLKQRRVAYTVKQTGSYSTVTVGDDNLSVTYLLGPRETSTNTLVGTSAVISQAQHLVTSAVLVNGTRLQTTNLSIQCSLAASVAVMLLADDQYQVKTLEGDCSSVTLNLPWTPSADRTAVRVYSQGHAVAINSEVSRSGKCSFAVEHRAEYTVEVYRGLVGPTQTRLKIDDDASLGPGSHRAAAAAAASAAALNHSLPTANPWNRQNQAPPDPSLLFGCSTPRGPRWRPSYAMGDSLYMYCYTNENTTMGDRHPCPLGWMVKGGVPPGAFGGIVGFDHYFTSQGMPCKDGRPHEFELQDAAALWAKAAFPRARVLQYRITSAVPVSAKCLLFNARGVN